MVNAERWLERLANLNVYRAKGGVAPHKPLLLLVVLELAEQGLLPRDTLRLTPELAIRFCTYWGIVAPRRTQKPDVRLPFHHLSTGGFWSSLQEGGAPLHNSRTTQLALLNPGFVAFAADPASRGKARRILIAKYFQQEERVALYSLVGMPIPSDDAIAQDADYCPPEEAKRQGREMRFRLNVAAAYNYTCGLTGYRLTTISVGSIVDAAHIHRFSDSRNNDPRNGIALCKNAHWLFHNGLWSLTDDYSVIVAVGQFSEESPDHKALFDYQGQKVRLPEDRACWPSPIHLAWHRRNIFLG
jgi:putative restriction endonuclease